MQQYNYWGFGSNEPPSSLKTKKQLAELGLSAIKPVGFIETREYTLHLYDPNSPDSTRPKRKPTSTQLENLEKGRAKNKYRAWYRHCGFIEADRVEVVGWARELLESGCVILDTETTGLGDAEIVEIAVVDHQGETLLNTLVRPSILIPDEVVSIHGITDEMVSTAPTFSEVFPKLRQVLGGKTIAIYNADFDTRILNYCCKLYQLEKLCFKDRAKCLMYWYSRWYGEYSEYYKDYKWQLLNGEHRALGDCLTALKILKEMAADDLEMRVPSFD